MHLAFLCPECNLIIFNLVYSIDELAGFEESWKGNAGHYLPGWNQNAGAPNSDISGKQCLYL